MRYIKGICVFSAICMIFAASYAVIFYKQIGKAIPAEWWLVNVLQLKDMAVKSSSNYDKRILVVSGSNSLFSINSKIIEAETGYKTVNLGIHAGLDIDFYRYIINKYIKNGDIVVMPLEYEYYSRPNPYNDWFVNNMSSWGYDYLKSTPIYKAAKLLTYLSPSRMIEGARSNDYAKVDEKSSVLEHFNKPDGLYYGYSYRSLNADGDIHANPEIPDVLLKLRENVYTPLTETPYVSDYTLSELKAIKDIIDSHGGKMVLTYPVHYRNNGFNTSYDGTKARIKILSDKLSVNDTPLQCYPEGTDLEGRFFIEPPYHTNSLGADVRSTLLGECLKNILHENTTPYTMETVLKERERLSFSIK